MGCGNDELGFGDDEWGAATTKGSGERRMLDAPRALSRYGLLVMHRRCTNPAQAAALCLIVAACTQPPASPSCAGLGGTPMLEYQLFFGRGIPGRSALTDQEWADFAADAVTPRLPDGFTALDADGQWLNPATRRIIRERTKVLIVAVPDTPATEAAITAIKDAYRQQFHQQSVGTVVQPVCAAF